MTSKKLTLTTLQSAALDKAKLQQFLYTHAGKEIHEKVKEAVSQYIKMLNELKYMEEHLPELITGVKEVKSKVDKRHKRSSVAIIGGGTTSFFGGAMILGGIAAAPFTLGTSIGLTAVGTGVTIGGSVATTVAKGADVYLGSSDYKKTEKKIDQFLEHYNAAENAYNRVKMLCEEIAMKMFPSISSEEKKSLTAIAINALISTAGGVLDTIRVPKTAVGTTFSGMTICKAFIAPAELHEATKLALTPTKSITLTRQFLTESTYAIRCAAKLDFSGCKLATVSSFRTISVIFKTAGVVLTLGGMVFDAYSVLSTSWELYKGKECKVSRNLSERIAELEELETGLRKLDKELTTKSITT